MHCTNRARLWTAGIFTIAALLAATPAVAQETAPAPVADAVEEGGLTDIVVTAQKRSQNLQDVSATVQALSGEDLAKNGVNDVSRLEQLSPGIVFAKGGNRSEEHTSELQSLMPISYAVFCLKKKKT